MIEWRLDAIGLLATNSKRAFLRLEMIFFEVVDLTACGVLVITRLAADRADVALAAGTKSAADKAKNPTIFNALFKIFLDMVEPPAWIAIKRIAECIEIEKVMQYQKLAQLS